jgi:hypothetical protein
MPRRQEKLILTVTTGESLVDLKQHVAIALGGALGIEDVKIEAYVEPQAKKKKPKPVEEPEGRTAQGGR